MSPRQVIKTSSGLAPLMVGCRIMAALHPIRVKRGQLAEWVAADPVASAT
jgi:hypothetical protein